MDKNSGRRFVTTVLSFRHLSILLAGAVVAAGQVAPTFTTQPISQIAAVGGNVTFTVAATGAKFGRLILAMPLIG